MDNLSEVNKEDEIKRGIKSKQKIALYTKILDSINVM
jgi:hypothetical protein